MVARGGNAPPYAECESAALLLSYRAIEGKVAPAPGYAPGFSDRKSDVLLLHHAGKESVATGVMAEWSSGVMEH